MIVFHFLLVRPWVSQKLICVFWYQRSLTQYTAIMRDLITARTGLIKQKNGMLTRIIRHISLIMDCRLTITIQMAQVYAMHQIKGCSLIYDLVL